MSAELVSSNIPRGLAATPALFLLHATALERFFDSSP